MRKKHLGCQALYIAYIYLITLIDREFIAAADPLCFGQT